MLARGASAQQPTAGNTQEQKGTVSAPSSKPCVVPTVPHPDEALENPVLDEADDEHITNMASHIALEYNHDKLDGGADFDRIRIRWLQAFGPSKRFAAGIELPFLHLNAGMGPSANGFGDMSVEFRAMLQKDEKFEQAAGIELTMPSASTNVLGTGQTVMRLAWGFSTPITSQTLLSGEVGYDNAVATQRSEPGVNFLEPELLLTQAFGKRIAVFVDWDSYEDFHTTD